MVKKKMTESEQEKGNIKIESTDNKENKSKPAAEAESKTEKTNEELKVESPTVETFSTEEVPDKVVKEERSFEEKLAELQDKYLRISAEFDNYRKRTLREKMEISKYAAEDVLLKILPIMDDFERALKHLDPSVDYKSVKEGLDLIYSKFTEFLKQQGIREIESLNSDFNVDLHDAVAKTTVNEDEKRGKVVEVIQKGYYLGDKVIRHSKVVVGE